MEQAKHDAWDAGDSYDRYMGRWSRAVAAGFVDWLAPASRLDWLEVGCGTGALASQIVARAAPRSLLAVDSSDGFIAAARRNVPDPRVSFQVGDALALPIQDGSRDAVVSALFLNFIADSDAALREMIRAARPGGLIAFYVWDYPGGGMEFMSRFWDAAVALDPEAARFVEGKRFAFCTPAGLTELAKRAGLGSAECSALDIPTRFRNFDDFWLPFTLGTGPAPGYCASLLDPAREKLRAKLADTLPRSADGAIELRARAWAVKGRRD